MKQKSVNDIVVTKFSSISAKFCKSTEVKVCGILN